LKIVLNNLATGRWGVKPPVSVPEYGSRPTRCVSFPGRFAILLNYLLINKIPIILPRIGAGSPATARARRPTLPDLPNWLIINRIRISDSGTDLAYPPRSKAGCRETTTVQGAEP